MGEATIFPATTFSASAKHRVYQVKIRTHFCSGQLGKTSMVACDRQMMDGENLGRHLCDDHHVGRSPLVERIFVHHFVQRAGTAGAWQMEVQVAGKAQWATVVLE